MIVKGHLFRVSQECSTMGYVNPRYVIASDVHEALNLVESEYLLLFKKPIGPNVDVDYIADGVLIP